MNALYNKVIVAFCEGQHDVSFLSRILLVNGFLLENKKIGQLPSPFDKRFAKELGDIRIPDKKLGFQPNGPKLPSVFFSKEKTLVFIHNLNGDERESERKELIKMYKDLSGIDDFSIKIPYRFLFFFDADEHGIDARINKIRTEIGIDDATQLSNGSVLDFEDNEWGGYIFHDIKNKFGTLEDQLLGYFLNKNLSLKNDIETFLRKHQLESDNTRKFISSNIEERYKGASQYYEKKSILGVYTQLQFSGVSNAVMINQTDFIKVTDIRNCQQCITIFGLFS